MSGHIAPTAAQLGRAAICWLPASDGAVRAIISNPAYAGAYAYGRSRTTPYVDGDGSVRLRRRRLPREEWLVPIPQHHRGFIDWPTWERNQARLCAPRRAEAAKRAGPAGPGRIATATVDLVRRLAGHYSDRFIAAMLNREGRRTRTGQHFTARDVGSLRRHWRIPSAPRSAMRRPSPGGDPASGRHAC